MEVMNKNMIRIFLICIWVPVLLFAKNSLLVIRSEGVDFEEAVTGMSFELQYDFDISQMILTGKDVSVAALEKKIAEVQPDVVVLMNNVAIGLYKKYQEKQSGGKVIPSVSLMAILVSDMISGIKNSAAIEYEIPIVTSAIGLRSTLKKDIKKIGIVHRSNLNRFLEESRQFCQSEGVDLLTVEIEGGKKVKKELAKALATLAKEGVDALWVPNDNKLLSKDLLLKSWIPFQKKQQLPMIVGVKTLVNPKFHFGNFAVLPDHVALGSQAASIVFDIMDNDWQVYEDDNVQKPLSVKTLLNYPDAKSFFGLKKENVMTVDVFLE